MKICIIYWDLGLGGIQKRIRDLVTYVSTNTNIEIHILLRRNSVEGFGNQLLGLKNVHIHMYPFVRSVRPLFGFIPWLAMKYVYIQPNVTLTFQSLLGSLCVLFKYTFFWIHTRLVINEGAVTSNALNIDNIRVYGILIKLLYPFADEIIVPTIACMDDLVHIYSINPKKIKIIPNWTLFKKSTPLSPSIDILYIGRFSHEKNPLSLIQLAKSLACFSQRIKIVMVGNGYLQSVLQDQISKHSLEDKIEILPFTNTIDRVIRKTKILVVPSINEGMPNVVLEAAMSQIPCVANNFPGVHEVIKHGNTGYIFHTATEFSSYVQQLLVNPKKRMRFGLNAQKFVSENFGENRQVDFLHELDYGSSA